MSDYKRDKPDLRRRGLVFAALASAFAPKQALSTLTADSRIPVATGTLSTSAQYIALKQWISVMNLNTALVRTAIAAQMVVESAIAEEPSLLAISKLADMHAAPEALLESFFSKPLYSKLSSEGTGLLSKKTRDLLKNKPSKETIRAFLDEFIKDADDYKLVFGDRSIEEATRYLEQSINQGEDGLRLLLKNYDETHKAEAMKTAKEVIANIPQPIFTDMADSHKVGGYPIPSNHSISGRVLVKDRTHSGEWSERIKSAEKVDSLLQVSASRS